MFTITRIYSDANGESRFEELEIPLNEKGDIGLLSDALETRKMIFREVPPGYDYDFHTAPQRQYIILLDGSIEIETSVGEKRVFNGGDILLVEDTEGKGHRTRNLIPETRKSIFITF
ncbi:MAG TPA: hypothetical protein VF421_21015 [Niabella sp.]